jgi:two-component system, cell cycle response regulator CtrA
MDHAASVFQVDRLTVNLHTRTAQCDGQRLHLTRKEFAVLELLILRRGTTVTKEMLLCHLYGGINEPNFKIIDVFVCKLRKKLTEVTGGESCMLTIFGCGYVLPCDKILCSAIAEARPVARVAAD